MKKLLWILLAALLLLGGCQNTNPPSGSATESGTAVEGPTASENPSTPVVSEGEIPGLSAANFPVVDGSTANLPLIAQIYAKAAGVPVEEAETMVETTGTANAWRTICYDSAQLLLVYEAPDVVKEELAAEMENLEITPIGRDGLVFLVNNQNPVENLTREQLIGIYTGAVTNWSEVGGNDGLIAPFQRNEDSGSQTLFRKLLMGDTPPMKPATELISAGMGGLIDSVASYDGAGGSIGFSVFYYAGLMYENPDIKLLSVDGVEPSAASIQDGSYPLVNDFYLVTQKGLADDHPAAILRAWLQTPEASRMMRDIGYVPIEQ